MKKALSILMMSLMVTSTLAGCATKAPTETPAETPGTATEEPATASNPVRIVPPALTANP